MKSPFDVKKYIPCCGQSPRFTRDAAMWWALCTKCGEVTTALDGSPDKLADAWNELIERKDGGKKG